MNATAALRAQKLPVIQMEISDLVLQWMAAVASAAPQRVVDLYLPDAVLVPTLAKTPILSQEGRLEYFMNLLKRKNIHVEMLEIHTKDFGDIATASGIYAFSCENQHREKMHVPARFTFVFLKKLNEWRITEHHSSFIPDPNQF